MVPKNWGATPQEGSGYEPAFEERLRASWPRFLGGQGSIFNHFWMIFQTSWLTLGMFSAALAGGATPFQTPPLLTWFSLFLVRSSANFAKKIQELAEDKAENPRTCRGQSREQNPYERLQEKRKPSQDRGGLGGRSPPSKSSRKHAHSKPRSWEGSSKNLRKSTPDPPKIDAKTV